MKNLKPVILCIMDGFGEYKAYAGNAIKLAKTPTLDFLEKTFPFTKLQASEEYVGLPKGQMGNSEVGHLTIGSGRKIFQNLTLINHHIKSHTFEKNEYLLEAISKAKMQNGCLHIMGLYSNGGVHAHLDHINATINLALKEKVANIYLHLFLDGRDNDPRSSLNDIQKFLDLFKKNSNVHLLTLSGRYYSMDRDKNWNRCQLAYDVMATHKGASFTDPIKYIQENYDQNHFDEFIVPARNKNNDVVIKNNDVIISCNFRPDRIIQLAAAFSSNGNYVWKPEPFIKNIDLIAFADYGDDVKCTIAFPQPILINTLGEVLQNHHLHQLRLAETEKFAHVTYFFDGGLVKKYSGKKEILIKSPAVKTYDLQPEMSAIELTNTLLKELANNKHDVVIMNFANCDMVGHTGKIPATIKAVETIDAQIARIYEYTKKNGGIMLITADHGNADVMLDIATLKKSITSHSINPVPFIVTSNDYKISTNSEKTLADLSPTILFLLGIAIPKEMEGKPLITKK